MNDIKEWVKLAIEKGYDRYDLEDLLNDKEKYTNEQVKKILDEYDSQIEMKEGLKLGFFEKRRLKKLLKRAKEKANATIQIMEYVKNDMRKLTKKQKEELKELKEKMILSIIGDTEKEIIGLNTVFEITGKGGKEITRKDLEEILNWILTIALIGLLLFYFFSPQKE